METIRQGLSVVREISASPPTARTDGTPLPVGEIKHYNWYISFNGGPETLVGTPQITGGKFTDSFTADDETPGVYRFTYSTTDINDIEGPKSSPLEIEILAPLAPPNPPENIR